MTHTHQLHICPLLCPFFFLFVFICCNMLISWSSLFQSLCMCLFVHLLTSWLVNSCSSFSQREKWVWVTAVLNTNILKTRFLFIPLYTIAHWDCTTENLSHVSHHNSAISATFIAANFNFSHFSIRHIYMKEKTLCKCWEMLLEHLFQINWKKMKCSRCILFVFLIFLFSIFLCDRKHFSTVLNAATFVLDQLDKKTKTCKAMSAASLTAWAH